MATRRNNPKRGAKKQERNVKLVNKTETATKKRAATACSRCKRMKVKCHVDDESLNTACKRCVLASVAEECDLASVEPDLLPKGSSMDKLSEMMNERVVDMETKGPKTSKSTGSSKGSKRSVSVNGSHPPPEIPQLTGPNVVEQQVPTPREEVHSNLRKRNATSPAHHGVTKRQLIISNSEEEESDGSSVNEEVEISSGEEHIVDVESADTHSNDGESLLELSDHSSTEEDVPKVRRKKPEGKRKGKVIKNGSAENKKKGNNTDKCGLPAFSIPCGYVKNDNTIAPFNIPSTISYNDFRIDMATKFSMPFPGLIQLTYKLESDKESARMSLQTTEEFTLFIERMRGLIVPPRLSNGKISERKMKSVMVMIDDAERLAKRAINDVPGGKKSKLKLSTLTIDAFPSANIQPVTALSAANSELTAVTGELEERWKCDIHSKGPVKAYCYQYAGGPCLALSASDLGLWALAIIEARKNNPDSPKTTVETKPSTLMLTEARPRGRTAPAETPTPAMPPPFFGGYPMMPFPMWGAPPFIPQHPITAPATTNPQAQVLAPPATTPVVVLTEPKVIEYPKIRLWFRYLDNHPGRNKDGTVFAPFGIKLFGRGFKRLSALAGSFVTVEKLETWLEIDTGTACTILSYIEEDLEALKEGKITIADDGLDTDE